MEPGASFVLILILSVALAVALMLFAAGYLIGWLRHGRPSHVVFLPADRPIPVNSESYERAAEESGEATPRPKRFCWVLLGVMLGVFLQLGLLTLLGVAPKFCELRGWTPPQVAESSQAEPSGASQLSVSEK